MCIRDSSCTIIAFVIEITVLAKRVWPVGEVFPQLDFHVVDDTSKWSILTKAADKVMGGVIGPENEEDEELTVENLHASFSGGDFHGTPSGSFNRRPPSGGLSSVSYTHLRAHETPEHLVCRLLLEKKKNKKI
eukprot:TRINITY_DN35160_c0_g1_i1.p1 TRINITY_DN35160_c0_g1~~TRINITY_DN35160_c0_g1_i1.p1  ORF type:complete len:133 (-),score=30.30 TRINITY_DN35160_c0_g1_i1:9-407(-)